MSNNQKEISLFKEQMTQEEINALSDEQILAMIIADKRKRLAMNDAQVKASIRRRRR